MTDEPDIGKCPPWIDREEVFKDVAAIMVKYGLTVGHFYDALGINVYEKVCEEVTGPINRMAEIRRELTLQARKK